jgi:hypothetical protein
VRGTDGKGSGKWYFEVTINSIVAGDTTALALSNLTQDITSGFFGDSNNSISFYGDANVYRGNSQIGPNVVFANGNVVCFAVNCDDDKVWVRVDNGDWNDTPGADPGANDTNHYNIAVITGDIYIAAGLANTAQVTLNVGATSFTQAVPSGFSAWG